MKISLATLAVVAVADDKKVPPRTPLQRLNTLSRFVTNFADTQVATKLSPAAAGRFKSRIVDGMLNNFKNAFGRETCGHFNPNLPNGGPDPNPELRPNGKPRQRRDDDDTIEADFDDLESFCKENEGNPNQGLENFCCSLHTDGHTDVDFCGPNAPRSTGEVDYERLSNHHEVAWRQLTTGMRKWVERYINECHGQRKFKHGTKRVNRLYRVWKEKLGFTQF